MSVYGQVSSGGLSWIEMVVLCESAVGGRKKLAAGGEMLGQPQTSGEVQVGRLYASTFGVTRSESRVKEQPI